MKIRKLICTILAVSCMMITVSCSDPMASTKEERRTVMTIDGYDVPYEMYRYAALMHLRDRLNLISSNAEDSADGDVEKLAAALTDEEKKSVAREVKDEAVATLTEIYSLFTAAAKDDIDPFGDMVNSLTEMKMEELRATYESEEYYLASLEMYHMNDSVYSLLTRYEIVFDRLYETYVKNGDIDITNEAAIEYLQGDMAARAKQILISFERHSEEEAKKLADEVSAIVEKDCIKADGTVDTDRFDELTDKYGEDLFMFKNRDGYYISKGYNDKAFEEAVFALEIGEISQPVRLSAGYSIILRAPKDLAYIEDNVDTLKEASLTGIYRGILEEYSANAEVDTKGIEDLDIYSMK